VTLVSAKDKVTDWPNVKYKTWQIIGGICTERVRIEKEISDRNCQRLAGGGEDDLENTGRTVRNKKRGEVSFGSGGEFYCAWP